jgi:hypothetical protein
MLHLNYWKIIYSFLELEGGRSVWLITNLCGILFICDNYALFGKSNTISWCACHLFHTFTNVSKLGSYVVFRSEIYYMVDIYFPDFFMHSPTTLCEQRHNK